MGLSDTNRTAAGFANVVNDSFCSPADQKDFDCSPFTAGQMDRTALALFNSPALPGEPGKWLIPNDTGVTPTPTHPYNAFLPGTGRFKADLAVANLDYNATAKDTLSLKYFYQHDPTIAPYAFSSVPGFTEHLDSGAQVASINNTYLVKPNLSTTRDHRLHAREELGRQRAGLRSLQHSRRLARHSRDQYLRVDLLPRRLDLQRARRLLATGLPSHRHPEHRPERGRPGSNTGVFQNRWQPSGDAIWTLGRHTVSFGASYSYTQLNTIDNRTSTGTVATDDFSQFAQGHVTPGSSSTGFYVTSFLQGNANRYYRANQLGIYVQDKFQITPSSQPHRRRSLRLGWRPHARSTAASSTSSPTSTSTTPSSDTIVNSGLIIAA